MLPLILAVVISHPTGQPGSVRSTQDTPVTGLVYNFPSVVTAQYPTALVLVRYTPALLNFVAPEMPATFEL